MGAARLGYRLARSVPSKSAPGGAVRAAFTQLTYQASVRTSPTSPDSKTFLYASAASGNADIFPARGRPQRDQPDQGLRGGRLPAAASPDGSQIAFRSDREGGGIFLMGATGRSPSELTDFGFNPAWSPTGRARRRG
jgi:Tol biopolymer transport system component